MSHALLEEAPPTTEQAPASASTTSLVELAGRWAPFLALAGAIAIGASVYAEFWKRSHELWWWMGHDRHTHYMYGLNLALDVRTGDFMRLLHDIDRMRVWGPVHPFAVALIQFCAGPDHRLAVLPSVLGYILTIWCAFLIPRRLLSTGGTTAGLLAAMLVAASPAHRAYATDCMYESLGAGLSLAVIYLYLATLQDGARRHAIALGITLSVLFLHKYNFWLLALFGVIGGEFLRQPRAWLEYGRSLCRKDRLPSWLLAELKQPLSYVALAFAVAALVVLATGGKTIMLGRTGISMQEPHNFVHLAYIAFFLRALVWWRVAGRAWSNHLPPSLRELLLWHLTPVSVWFLLPKRLSYFLWFLSPSNSDQVRESVPFMHGLPTYLQGLQVDYLAHPSDSYLLSAMIVGGLIAWRFMKPGSSALFCFLLVSIYLTCQHPMLKFRFMHSWFAALWVVGSVGLIFAVQQVIGLIARVREGDSKLGAGFAGLVCGVLALLHGPALFESGRAQESGVRPNEPSPLRITETYLPSLADTKNPTILSNVSTRFLWTWTFIDHHRHQNMAGEIKNFKSYEDNPEQVKRWLATTPSDALVLIDIQPYTTYDWKTMEYVDLAVFKQTLQAQDVWRLERRWQMPEGVTIQLWKKRSS